MPAAPLPPVLEDRLRNLAGRVRRMRIADGACRFTLVLIALSAAGLLLDAAFQLSVAMRCVLEVAGLGVVGILAWRLVWRPWQTEVPLEEIARQIEAEYPALAERLLTVVSLRDDAGSANGSPQLVAALARDTEIRSRELDFERVFPTKFAARFAGLTLFILFASLTLAIALPGSGERLRRVALPWHRPGSLLPYEIIVTSGDSVVRRGEPITLTAYLRPRDPNAALPDSATLVLREGQGERKLPMTGDATATFSVTRPSTNDDFEYRVLAGPAASEWHTVRVADAVELTDQSTIEITPPAYANQPAKTLSGVTDLDGLQYSSAQLRLRFNRPAESAFLEWRPEGRTALEAPDLIPVALAPDRLAGEAPFRIRASGVLRIVLVNESGPRKLRTETSVNVRAISDAPPRFEQVTGVATQPRTARPGERIFIDFAAADDFGIAAAELEYAVGPEGNPVVKLPIPLTGGGTPKAEGRFLFDLAGKGTEGTSIRYRLRVRDTRQVEEAKFGPQEALYPPAGWSELKLAGSAPPLDQQEIFGIRDSIREVLAAAIKELKESRGDAEVLRADTAGRSPLPIDHGLRLGIIRERVQKVKASLETAARDLALTPDLRSQAAAIREVAERPLADADDALRKAATDNASVRAAELGTTLTRLFQAIDRLEELQKQNERLAQDRLDRRRLEALAVDQGSLADQAKPAAATPREELLKKERELLDRLNRLLAESDPLRKGAEAAAARETERLAAEAKEIAGLLRDLDAAANRTNEALRAGRLMDLSNQERLLQQTIDLQRSLETPTRLAGLAALDRKEIERVLGLIAQDKIVEALTELERLALANDRMAAEFDRWAAERNDPKLAARQLAKWQDDLRTRFLAAIKPRLFANLPDAQKLAFRTEQNALLQSTERLKLPPDAGIVALRDAALVHVRAASKRLADNGMAADEAMTSAIDSLNRLADKTPGVAERLIRMRAELDKIRIEQDAIIAAADPIVRQFEKQAPTPAVIQAVVAKFVPLQLKQSKLADRLAALDLPTHEARHARAMHAAKAASADLTSGVVLDAFASLSWSHRQLEWLRQVLDNQMPADDKVEELARKQAEVFRLFLTIGEHATVRQLEPAVALQQDVFRQMESLAAKSAKDAPEAPALFHDAREFVKLAEQSLRDLKHEQILRRTREAAEALALLADRLNDREVEQDRVRRLAANRRQGVCIAKSLAGKDANRDASAAAKYELSREAEELLHTRTGEAGQAAKQRGLELFVKLQARTEPDRQAAEQKALAEALAELAGTMGGAELSTRPGPLPMAADPAEAFLPSKGHADSLRDLARRQRELRERTNGLTAEMNARSKPSATNPLAEFEDRQRVLAAAVEVLAKALGIEKDPLAEDAGKAAVVARQAANDLANGDLRRLDSIHDSAKQLRALAVAGNARAWGKTADSLAATQEAILADLAKGVGVDSFAASAAQQKAKQEALAKKAFELAHMLDLAGKNAPAGDPGAKQLAEAANLARMAEQRLTDAAKKIAEGLPAEAARLRAEADRFLQQAADRAAMARPPVLDAPEAGSMAAGESARDAERSMQRAIGELGAKGDASAAEQAMRRATEALNKAAKSTGAGASSQPSGKPGPGSMSNGNTGAGSSPSTAGELTSERIEGLAKSWGELPGEVKAKFVQDLQARYGEDYARAIKHYFEQLAVK